MTHDILLTPCPWQFLSDPLCKLDTNKPFILRFWDWKWKIPTYASRLWEVRGPNNWPETKKGEKIILSVSPFFGSVQFGSIWRISLRLDGRTRSSGPQASWGHWFEKLQLKQSHRGLVDDNSNVQAGKNTCKFKLLGSFGPPIVEMERN